MRTGRNLSEQQLGEAIVLARFFDRIVEEIIRADGKSRAETTPTNRRPKRPDVDRVTERPSGATLPG